MYVFQEHKVLNAETKKRLQRSTQLLLREKLENAVRELGYLPQSKSASSTPVPQGDTSRDGDDGDQGTTDMQAFVSHAKRIYETGLERDLVIREMSRKKGDVLVILFAGICWI